LNPLDKIDQSQITLKPGELVRHVQISLDESHRELAFFRAGLIGLLYLLLTAFNWLLLDDDVRSTAVVFSSIVVICFAAISIFHRRVSYPAAQTNLITFVELMILQADAIAFSLVTEGLMDGFGVYMVIVGAGIFITSTRWLLTTIGMLAGTWALAVLWSQADLVYYREALMLGSALFCSYFFYAMRIRSATRLGEHQLMEQKYKESLEYALIHIDTLSGLLPICASCKNIRDDKGDWSQIETYVSERSRVEFTHSVCPECQKVLYPEL
jgi:hypothetical protein